MSKIFDWEKAKNFHQETTLDYFRLVFDKNIDEQQFVEDYQSLPKRRGSKSHKPSKAKRLYNYLKNEFGFFVRK